ncbi:NADH-ubiquinone oxidoreductase-F iron-sulfur binding region domain-containing protein [Dichotomicrobium thermohalophilum]|uniref:NAD-dependent formate dehydrogenase flavoprotein subunit n=1 Tax=Dichotomicrobium thermohalophilum TaxID=933063 RepID=A0A397PDZ7_9HYPH|nr:NADH-ubiquinone oxidoreductase-F iron-sulfur binding region domain-containing protein [Dichotomicrobium thermohalophilum]RIA47720.1 NAD-dependent formate dehydrogenase flavoprotein subunit [Dichotomicrobium thermohalophilum]
MTVIDLKRAGFPKGRPVEDGAVAEVSTALEGRPIEQRDLLIEHLHVLQDRFDCLHERHLRALAHLMRLSQAEVWEVASFYHHFDLVKEGQAAPPPVTIRVCDTLSCAMAGAENLIETLEQGCDPGRVRVLRAPCMGRCAQAPAARCGNVEVGNATAEGLLALASGDVSVPAIPHYKDFDAYRAEGGYRLLEECRSGQRNVDDIIAELSDAGLAGLGGAGFPAGRKWSIVRGFLGPRLMTINGDEGEPGTFKDRYHLERDPHRMFEGALIAAWAVGAERIYLYMRDEYPAVLEILRREIAALDAAGLTADCPIELRRGAGAYICGEESAMLESIEGKRGLPRHRPPYIAEVGLFGRPTLNHNVETLWWLRDIIERGAQWFEEQGKHGHKGLRSYSVSGRVREPGVKLAPAGITLRELVDDYCGGMADGHMLKAYLPGGASGGIFPASLAELPLDFGGALNEHGGFIGSHAVIVLSQQDNVKDAVLNLMHFFADESCGQCTPCRAGTEKMVKLLQQAPLDEDAIADLEEVMRDASICGLGQAAPNPVNHLLKWFREDLMEPQAHRFIAERVMHD